MDTDTLIKSLTTDARRQAVPLASLWWVAVGGGVAVAAAIFVTALGPRPDFAAAIETPRFLFKFVVTIALAGGAFIGLRALSRPGENWRAALAYIAIAPVLLAAAAIVELALMPPQSWMDRLIGTNIWNCLTTIPLLGAGPLLIFVLALRHSAPVHPALAGGVAGLLAGGIAATFYAAECTDDSPLFVVAWYTVAVGLLAIIGAALGNRLARW